MACCQSWTAVLSVAVKAVDVVVAFGSEGGAGIDDVDARAVGVGGGEADVDGGDHDVGDEVGVLEVARFEVEERVDPDGGDGAVVDGEDSALFVMRGLGVEELRVPVLARPETFAFGSEERRGFGVGQVDDDVECCLRVKQLRRERSRLPECRSGENGRGGNGECAFHRLRSLRWWLSEALSAMP